MWERRWNALLLDLSFAVRSLRNSLGFTAVAVTTLTLVIACNAIVFSVVSAVLLRPLPYPNANRLVVVHRHESNGQSIGDISASAFFLVKERVKSFESVTAVYASEVGVNLAGAGAPRYVRALRVSKDFFRVSGIMPATGRDFRREDDEPNGLHSAILSYGLWQQNFNKDPEAVGSALRINSQNYTIIGVMPRNFRSYPEADVWLPLQLSPATADPGSDYRVIARLSDAFSLQQAQQELEKVSAEFPLKYLHSPGRVTFVLQGLQAFETRDVRGRLALLFGTVVFVLLIACANLALLLLVRASARNHEIAIRVALGSSWARLIQIFLTESAVLAALGGLLGIGLAKELLPLVLQLAPVSLPMSAVIDIDCRVILFTFATSALTCFLFGLAPALPVSRVGLNEMLRQTARGASASAGQRSIARVLVSAQTALTLVLVVGATVLVRNFVNVASVRPGFEPQRVWVAQVSLAAQRYQTTAPAAALLDQVLGHLEALPGIESVASVNGLPLERGLNLPVYPTDAVDKIEHAGEYRIIGAGYFQTMQIPLLQGRSFSGSDGVETEPVAIVNETLAHRWWPHTSALGHFVAIGKELGQQFADTPRLVIAVATDIHQSGLDQPPPPTVFVPMAQAPDGITAFVNKLFLTSILVRASNHANVSDQIRGVVSSADPDLSLASLRPLTEVVDGTLARDRFYASLTAGFSALALLITAIGLYGLLSYEISLRTREIAVRMSLGARHSQVASLVVREALRLVVIGVVIGGIGALFIRPILSNMVYNVTDVTLGTVINAIVLLGIVALLASVLTAVRAASIEPMVVLRNE